MATDTIPRSPGVTGRPPEPAKRARLPHRIGRALGRVGAGLSWLIVVAGALVVLVPFLWMLGVAFRTSSDLYADPARIVPQQWTLHGIQAVLSQLPFGRLILNTFVFAGGATLLLLHHTGARSGTGAPRRVAQLLGLRDGLRCVPIRGNANTRLAKVASGELDAVVLACAGLVGSARARLKVGS